MRPEIESNRAYWDDATDIHARGNVNGIDDFKAGRCRLHRVELEAAGDVRGSRCCTSNVRPENQPSLPLRFSLRARKQS